MENFKVGEEVIFKNYRLQLGDEVVFSDNFLLSCGRISDYLCDENDENKDIKYYLITAVNSDFSIVTYGVPASDVIRTVRSLDKLEL